MNPHTEEHQEVIAAVEEALAILIDKKDFSAITISELVKKAGIARSTFYRNYESKEDIIRSSIRKTLSEFDEQFTPRTICTGVIVTVTFHEVDSSPNAKTCTKCNYECLKYAYCALKKCHNVNPP